VVLNSGEIAKITGGRLIGRGDIEITDLATDSRQVNFTENVAFIALKGSNHDGNQFIEPLYRQGVRVFVAGMLPPGAENLTDSAFIITDDTVKALQDLASWKRASFKSTVVAVTGSAGKTIVKEWLADVIGRTTAVIRSPKSYNSQIGVPLSVWKLEDKFTCGIFEAGISLPGEMEKLRRIIDPDIGIITNIGDAHSENFPDLEAKGREKLRLFANASMIIYCSDQPITGKLISEDRNLSSKVLTGWSLTDPHARVYVKKRQPGNGRTGLEITFDSKTYDLEIPFIDRASVENAITVASACFAMGIRAEDIREGLAHLTPVAMRMELKSGINNCSLIEDYYNSDPGSLGMALEYLKLQNHRKTTLILSDFIQSGRDEKELYGEVATLIARTGIDRFIGIGQALMRNKSLFGSDVFFFYSTDDFIRNFSSIDFRDEIILLKGARIFEFERIEKLLEFQVHTTILEINLDAISHNLNEFRRHLNPGTRIMAMVKAFAYGAGPAEIAGLMEYHRVNYLAVAYVDEGVELRNSGVTMPVMVMNPDPSSAGLIIQNNLEPEIYSFSSLTRFTEAAERYGLYQYPVHIKIDTGMHRLGFMPGDIEELAGRLKNLDCIRVMSVFSHLAGSDDPALDSFTRKQIDVFLATTSVIRESLGYPFLRHILNTSGIARFPQYQFDMVRPGIGIYGAGSFRGLDLKPVGRYKTRVSQVKEIPAGEPVGYGCADVSDTRRTIGILPVGYADGLSRRLGNRNGQMFLKGKKVPIVGNICMDMCMVDITGTGAAEGDEPEIFGLNISIDEVAIRCGTIPYEILTSVPARVKRVFFRE
jgi:Alr-MurF fusion protein